MSVLVAALADVFIYRSVVCLHFRRLPARVAYIFSALVVDGAALSVLGIYGFWGGGSSVGVVTVMWLLWLFILATLPKLLYILGTALDFATRRVLSRRRVTVFRWFFGAASLAIVGVMVYGATVGRTSLKVREVEISSPRIPEGFDGYRVVQISDLHLGTMTNPEKQIADLVARIAELDPDMVVSTGDLVNLAATELTPEIMALLSTLTARDGTFSVWGNHDLGFYLPDGDSQEGVSVEENFADLESRVRAMGWRVLSDESVWIRRGDYSIGGGDPVGRGDDLASLGDSSAMKGDSILLTGLDYPRGTHHNGNNSTLAGADIDKAFEGMEGIEGSGGDPYNIVLAHTPVMWDDVVSRNRGDVTLSGHTHAMQMKLRLFGLVWSPAQYMYEEWSGRYFKGGAKNNMLYVNDGIGCVGYPMRTGDALPEVTLFRLTRCE
ncbi:MAG: metallophosphoesterase [Alistipes sp.]|nr:metallophosphoesterase [Alistipes sp.]